MFPFFPPFRAADKYDHMKDTSYDTGFEDQTFLHVLQRLGLFRFVLLCSVWVDLDFFPLILVVEIVFWRKQPPGIPVVSHFTMTATTGKLPSQTNTRQQSNKGNGSWFSTYWNWDSVAATWEKCRVDNAHAFSSSLWYITDCMFLYVGKMQGITFDSWQLLARTPSLSACFLEIIHFRSWFVLFGWWGRWKNAVTLGLEVCLCILGSWWWNCKFFWKTKNQ